MEVKAVNAKNLMWAVAAATLIGYGAGSAVAVGWGMARGLLILGLSADLVKRYLVGSYDATLKY